MGSLQGVSMTVVRWAMYLAPVAVFGLIAQLAATIGLGILGRLGIYGLTVVFGLLLLVGFYSLILITIGRLSPWRLFRTARETLLLAFSTSSSAAVMPLTIKTAGELGVRQSVAQFVVPIGTTINMDGTALYQITAVLFLAQIFGIDMGLHSVLLVSAITIVASIGSPGTPGVSIAILALSLETVGIPASGVALILGVDRILDMCRTAVNVTGDLVASVVMDRWVGGPQTHITEAVEEAALDRRRAVTGEDVIIEET